MRLKNVRVSIAMAFVFLSTLTVAHAEIQSSPIGAKTACNDGMFSTSSGSGTCSGNHGGVLRRLTADESSGRVPFNASASDANATASNDYQSPPIDAAPAAASYEATQSEYLQAETRPLPNTGGEPLLMMCGGSFLALGAFMLRRRIV